MQLTTEKRVTTKDRIVAALKDRGYTSKHVTVSKRHAGYSSALKITIRDAAVNHASIEKISQQFESIDRDDRTGEILSGGNIFVDVSLADNVSDTWAAKYLDKVNAAMTACTEAHGETIDERFTIHRNGRNQFKVWDETRSGWVDGDWWNAKTLAVNLYILTQEVH